MASLTAMPKVTKRPNKKAKARAKAEQAKAEQAKSVKTPKQAEAPQVTETKRLADTLGDAELAVLVRAVWDNMQEIKAFVMKHSKAADPDCTPATAADITALLTSASGKQCWEETRSKHLFYTHVILGNIFKHVGKCQPRAKGAVTVQLPLPGTELKAISAADQVNRIHAHGNVLADRVFGVAEEYPSDESLQSEQFLSAFIAKGVERVRGLPDQPVPKAVAGK
ncbi:hypothetical protein KIPB_009503 [Kipferlia bialata]|uniref:Uncharacterized protein n=1 Tax=Kipferlia bialata TaxID=797122 RepID=A0A9K3D1W1_9EUKA|nr:hypothetical protein KIPB_009503 [Kipferlia bialata]|eukprot:g9503.t1